MEVYNTDYALYVQDGEHEPKQATNFTPRNRNRLF